MNFITKNKKMIIISAAVIAAIVLVTIAGILIGKAIYNSPKNIVKRISEAASEFETSEYACHIEYTLNGITLKGEYILTVSESDGEKSAELSYRYDKLNAIGESDDFISEISGTLYARGEDEVGELKDSAIVWESGVIPSGIPKLDISTDIFESFEASAKDGILSLEGTLKKDLPAEGIDGARLTISCDEKNAEVISLTLEYTDPHGAKVTAVYSYSGGTAK